MSTQNEATARPWDRIKKGDLYKHTGRHEIIGANRETICRMHDLSETSYANAALIVQAVNSHDALTKVATKAAHIFEACASEPSKLAEGFAKGLAKEARAALVLARGEAPGS